MKLKRLLALLLCISFLSATIAGCSNPNTEDVPAVDTPVEETADTAEDEHIHDEFCEHSLTIDFDAAIANFAPDTAMLKSDDLEITWAVLYVFLFRTVTSLMQAYGMPDWDDIAPDGSKVSDLVLEYATDEAITFLIYMYGIKENNLVLNDDELKEFNEDIEEIIAIYGGKDELVESLREHGGFYDFDVFENLFKLEFSIGSLVDRLYGEDASDFPVERVEEYASEHEYMMALHILRLKAEDENDDTPLNEINDILAQLKPRAGSDDFVDFFKELMAEHSEDHGGMISFPDGYLFQPADMVEPFSTACAALEEGGLSDVVETAYGYHIILRLPLDFEAVPIAFANEGMPRTLRQAAVLEDFSEVRREWRDALNVEFTPEYNSINLSEIFKVLEN